MQREGTDVIDRDELAAKADHPLVERVVVEVVRDREEERLQDIHGPHSYVLLADG